MIYRIIEIDLVQVYQEHLNFITMKIIIMMILNALDNIMMEEGMVQIANIYLIK